MMAKIYKNSNQVVINQISALKLNNVTPTGTWLY